MVDRGALSARATSLAEGAADAASAEPPPDGEGLGPLRIVAVGASAGGLGPLERLFANLPPDTGCAFVVVQHLSPDFRSMMVELLARHTSMRIRRLEDGMTLERDCIYLNLPRSVATLEGTRVRIESGVHLEASSRPIDALFESLADEHGERALAIVLSGTGSDGRHGCGCVVESGGTVLAQSPLDARFDSMPRAIIDAGLADVIAPPDELAGQVLRWTRGETLHDVRADDGENPFTRILGLLRVRFGTDFLNYKHGTLRRRMQRRADMRGLPDLERYASLLGHDGEELDELYGDLLIEVTSFFRDDEVFERLAEAVMPDLVRMIDAGTVPRIWVPGCASGEEPYSLAIVLAERAAAAGVPLEARIIATDIHGRSLERAAIGRYPLSSVAHLDLERIDAHFERRGDERSIDRRRAYRLALERVVSEHAPPGFLLTEAGDVVHIFGDAGALLPMSRGAFSSRITELVVPELRAALFAALQFAREPTFDGFSRRVRVPVGGRPVIHEIALERIDIGTDAPGFLLLTVAAESRATDVSPERRTETGSSRQVSVTGTCTGASADDGSDAPSIDGETDSDLLLQRIRDLEHDLASSEQSLQRTIDVLEATNEELQSTNEELHSVNEELHTVSAEHQHRIEELSALSADIDRLLHSTEIGTIILDRDLRLRRVSERAGQLFGLCSRDIGHDIGKTGGGTPAELTTLASQVLRTRAQLETDLEVGGRRHLLRLVPYFDADDTPGGVLMTSVDVTELTETRSELVRIDQEFRAIVEDTSSFIVRWRAEDSVITYCNGVYAALFGTPADELIGQPLEGLIPEREREEFFGTVRSITPGESRMLSVVREDPDGRATYTVGYTRAIADEAGNTIEYQCTGQDLSHEHAYRRALEHLVETIKDPALGHEERLLRILALCLRYLGLSSAFVSRIDGTDYTVIAVAGDAAARYSSGDVLPLAETVCANLPDGSGLLAIEHLARSELASHPCHEATGIESFIGARLLTAEGEFGSIAFSAPEPRDGPFTIAEESFVMLVASWIGYMIDSRRQLERVARSNDYHQSLYLGVPVALCLTDEWGLITEVSDEWLDHLGRERHSSLGTAFVDILDEGDREKATAAIRQGFAESLSLCVRDASGTVVEHEMSCRTRTIGTLTDRRLIVLTDVSGRRRAIDELESRNAELALANENLNQFAFVASHDLQEPLRKIRQFSGFLVEDDRDALSEDGRYHLEVIVEAAERMSSLIRDLLQYSRATRNSLDREAVALDEVLARVRDDLALPLTESGATLRILALPRVSGDPTLLTQLFTNLVANSIKYRDTARPLEIEVRAERHEGRTRIVVEDNGIGFDPVYARKVFEPFTRLHGAKNYKGSGIGLAICATVCRKHGWNIGADGRPDAGATFAITLGSEDGTGPGESDRDENAECAP